MNRCTCDGSQLLIEVCVHRSWPPPSEHSLVLSKLRSVGYEDAFRLLQVRLHVTSHPRAGWLGQLKVGANHSIELGLGQLELVMIE